MLSNRLKLWIVFICIWCVAFAIACFNSTQKHNRKIYGGSYVTTKSRFMDINDYLLGYIDSYGSIPENAEIFREYCKSQRDWLPGESLISLWKADKIIGFKPNTKISDTLDGTGGWYYDKERIMIVPNVTIAS